MDMTRPLGRGGYLINVVAILLVCGLLGTGINWVCNVVIPERAAEARAAELAQEQAAAAAAAAETAEASDASAEATETVPEANGETVAEPVAEANGEQAAAETAPAETPPSASPATAPAEEHHNVFFEVSIYLFIVVGFFGLGVLLLQCIRRLQTIGWPGLLAVLLFIPGVNALFLLALALPGDKQSAH
jgi:hypothetical protein